VTVTLRIDTPIEVDYYRHGGILPFVLRQLLAATLPLNPDMAQRYGAPYCTVHRADLHAVLLDALAREGGERLKTACPVRAVRQDGGSVTLSLMSDLDVEGDLLVGADGLWSTVRQHLLGDGAAVPTGHVAYRALAVQQALPAALRSQQVTAWLGPRLHVVLTRCAVVNCSTLWPSCKAHHAVTRRTGTRPPWRLNCRRPWAKPARRCATWCRPCRTGGCGC
jgi:2-polyprenyl-6-methoxyphenol hydroxylase-like FAD-dependent oxidoreductase